MPRQSPTSEFDKKRFDEKCNKLEDYVYEEFSCTHFVS